MSLSFDRATKDISIDTNGRGNFKNNFTINTERPMSFNRDNNTAEDNLEYLIDPNDLGKEDTISNSGSGNGGGNGGGYGGGNGGGNGGGGNQFQRQDHPGLLNFGEPQHEMPPMIDYEDIQEQKASFLSKLSTFASLNPSFMVRKMSMANDLEEIKGEYLKVTNEKNLKRDISRCRLAMQGFASLVEWGDEKMEVLGTLDGFGDHTTQHMGDYDDIFVDLIAKYQSWFELGSPEVRLVGAVGMSIAGFHLKKKMTKGMSESIIGMQKQPMRGPSEESNNALRNLNIGNDSDTESITSRVSSMPSITSDIITIQEEPEIKPKRKYTKRAKK
jgi:hypothetical protein